MTNSEPVMRVRDLRISYRTGVGRTVEALRGIDFDIHPGESLGLVGESGCGKSTLGMGLLRLLPKLGRVTGGSVTYRHADGRETDVLKLRGRELRQWRWSETAMVFQGAMNAFNPVLKIIDQFGDTLRAHMENGKRLSRKEVFERSAEAVRSVRLEPERVLPSYPHELSGGMRQRALIALSLLLRPRVLVLDEPTTALDLLTQRSIVDMLHELRAEHGFAMIFISHDLPLASELADRVSTMYGGRIVECGPMRDVFGAPRHPYTAGLVRAVPPVHAGSAEPISIPGTPPDLAALPGGCTFAERCAYAIDRCRETDPDLETVAENDDRTAHQAACIRWREVGLDKQEAA
ncbi:MAG: ABC transporter ATP-binding protein [Stackebrandtia sp.]